MQASMQWTSITVMQRSPKLSIEVRFLGPLPFPSPHRLGATGNLVEGQRLPTLHKSALHDLRPFNAMTVAIFGNHSDQIRHLLYRQCGR